jgi:hypothetical protein
MSDTITPSLLPSFFCSLIFVLLQAREAKKILDSVPIIPINETITVNLLIKLPPFFVL